MDKITLPVIPQYYNKLFRAESNAAVERYKADHKNCGLKIGDTVLVVGKAPNYGNGWYNGWDPGMDEYIGSYLRIMRDEGIYGFRLEELTGKIYQRYLYPFYILRKEEPRPYLTDNYRNKGWS